jgi:hypothetical protein
VVVDSGADPVCDTDQSCDDTCMFGFHCPTCCGCGAPCYLDKPVWGIPVPVGCSAVLPPCEYDTRPALILECQPRPAGAACPTTTTTLLPVGSCRTDDDCLMFPPRCQHCELGSCQGMPTLNPDRYITGYGCAIPHVR